MIGSLCRTPETKKTLHVNYTLIINTLSKMTKSDSVRGACWNSRYFQKAESDPRNRCTEQLGTFLKCTCDSSPGRSLCPCFSFQGTTGRSFQQHEANVPQIPNPLVSDNPGSSSSFITHLVNEFSSMCLCFLVCDIRIIVPSPLGYCKSSTRLYMPIAGHIFHKE